MNKIKKTILYLMLPFLLVFCLFIDTNNGYCQLKTLLRDAYLQTPMNGNGKSITNVVIFQTSNTCGTTTFDVSKPYQWTNTTTAITFSAITGQVDDFLVRNSVLIVSNNAAAGSGTIALTIPGEWKTGDGNNVYYVTNSAIGVLSVNAWGISSTNAVFRNLW